MDFGYKHGLDIFQQITPVLYLPMLVPGEGNGNPL